MTDDKRLVGVRLEEDELAALNLYLQRHGYHNLSEFVRSIVQGRFTRQELTESIRSLIPVNGRLLEPTIKSVDTMENVNDHLCVQRCKPNSRMKKVEMRRRTDLNSRPTGIFTTDPIIVAPSFNSQMGFLNPSFLDWRNLLYLAELRRPEKCLWILNV